MGKSENKNEDEPKQHFLVIGTTSYLETIDFALRRAGRFDKEIAIGIPDERSRIRILEIVCRYDLIYVYFALVNFVSILAFL